MLQSESPPQPADTSATPSEWSRRRWGWLTALTITTFLIHGYHPLAEDGGLYTAGVEFLLNRSLFPRFTAFVTEHLHFSIFAPALAAAVRLTHLSLATVLLLTYLGSIALTFIAAMAVLRRAVRRQSTQLASLAMLSAMWTLPVAATSLMLFDPYVTARSFSTPLSLFAIAFALDPWPSRSTSPCPESWRSLVACTLSLTLAALLHPLMAGYALGLVLVLRLLRRPRNITGITLLAVVVLVVSGAVQRLAPPEGPSVVWASLTRYYWFLSQWRWYELCGLVGPVLVFAVLLRWPRPLREPGARLCRAAIILGVLSVLIALLFAHESYHTHLVARLQPLRCFLPIYAVMVLLFGAGIESLFAELAARTRYHSRRRLLTSLPALLIAITALITFSAQRVEFRASSHLELPWRTNPNPWVRAFLWSRANTSPDALFALDAHYITLPGEDAQTFRAIAERSALPDFSKDGGEAAITPKLAKEWAGGVHAQTNLSREDDATRLARLQPFEVNWIVLLSSAATALPCPYDNGAVKVCRLIP
jgi:hypothetical protein